MTKSPANIPPGGTTPGGVGPACALLSVGTLAMPTKLCEYETSETTIKRTEQVTMRRILVRFANEKCDRNKEAI